MALQILEVRIIRRTLQEMTLRGRESEEEKELVIQTKQDNGENYYSYIIIILNTKQINI